MTPMWSEPVNTIHGFLQTQAWFKTLAPDWQARLAGQSRLLRAAKGQVVLPAGEQVQGSYAVLDGLVKLQSVSVDGKHSAFLGVPAGEWFGEGSVLKGEPRRYEVVALRDCLLMCLPREDFAELQRSHLQFNQFLVEHLNMRLGQAMAAIEAGRVRSPQQRVGMYLSRKFWPGTRRLYLTQEEIGILAGLSRQTVNRELRGLAAKGILAIETGRISILDDAALERMLERGDESRH